jgi:tRNA(fMet)-specific endonuclease VapC
MKYLLDTNIVSEIIKKPNGFVARKLRKKKAGSVGINTIVAAELHYGAKLKGSELLTVKINKTLKSLLPLNLPVGMAEIYGKTRAHLAKTGTPIGPNDLLIAAHALHQKLTLVTRNEAEFKRVPGLKVENWFE